MRKVPPKAFLLNKFWTCSFKQKCVSCEFFHSVMQFQFINVHRWKVYLHKLSDSWVLKPNFTHNLPLLMNFKAYQVWSVMAPLKNISNVEDKLAILRDAQTWASFWEFVSSSLKNSISFVLGAIHFELDQGNKFVRSVKWLPSSQQMRNPVK